MKKVPKKKKAKKVSDQVHSLIEASASFDEKPSDFGGLPDRNLKKNLGC